MNVDVLFIGGIWPENEESAIIENSKGNVQIAANMLQMSIIKGIEENLSEPLTIINEKFIGAFPQRYKKMIIRKYNFSHVQNQTHKDYNIGFINLPIVKHFCRYWNSRNSIRQACNSSKGDCIFVIGYSMTYSIVKGLLYAKKYNKKVKTCLIVPDLPEYMNLGNSRGKMFEVLKNYSNKKLAQLIKRLDSFVFIDDNPIERESVKNALPEVIVPDFPKDTSTLESFAIEISKRYFPVLKLTDEDLNKTNQYKVEQKRNEIKQKSMSIEEYLASLEMKKTFRQIDESDVTRAAQLTQKLRQRRSFQNSKIYRSLMIRIFGLCLILLKMS